MWNGEHSGCFIKKGTKRTKTVGNDAKFQIAVAGRGRDGERGHVDERSVEKRDNHRFG